MSSYASLEIQDLVLQARTDPSRVRAICEAELAADSDEQSRARLLLGRGWASFTQGDVPVAVETVRDLHRLGAERLVGTEQVARLESAVLVERGLFAEAEDGLRERLAGPATGDRAGLLRLLANTLTAAGKHEEAIEALGDLLAEWGDDLTPEMEALVRQPRSFALIELGRFDEAAADADRCRQVAEHTGDDYALAAAVHNLGVIAARQGALSTAIARFGEASALVTKAGDVVRLATGAFDQSDLFFDAGLLEEALDQANRAADLFVSVDAPERANRCLLQSARILATMRDWRAAIDVVDAAVRAHPGAGPELIASTAAARTSYQLLAALADNHGADAQSRRDLTATTLDIDDAAIERLPPAVATNAGLLLAQANLSAEARRFFQSAFAADTSRYPMQVLYQLVAQSSLALIDGRYDDAHNDVVGGLAEANAFALGVGVHELRTSIARRVDQLLDVGVQAGLRAGRPRDVVAVLEAAKSITLLPEPSASEDARGLSSRLRSVVKSLSELNDAGHDSHHRERLLLQRTRLETEIRHLHRTQGRSGTTTADVTARGPMRPGSAYMFRSGLDELHAIVVDPVGDLHHVELPPVHQVRRTVAGLRLALTAAACRSDSIDHGQLTSSLRTCLAPLLALFERHEQVTLIPDASIGIIPWVLLTETQVTHVPAPLAPAGDAADTGEAAPPTVGVVVGPELAHAETEGEEVRSQHRGAELVARDAATCDAAVRLFSSAELMHVVAHGAFRGDSPLYSSVRLFDGPLTLFDLLGPVVPAQVIFSSCDVGKWASTTSLGLASLLLGRGCRQLVASVGPVNDESGVKVMSRLHSEVRQGKSLSAALHTAQRAVAPKDPSVALLAAFGES